MKDYTQIEHVNKYIEERMKHCYDIGYEQGRKDEKEIHEGCDDVIRAFAEGILIGSMKVPKENVPQFPLSDKCCCEKEGERMGIKYVNKELIKMKRMEKGYIMWGDIDALPTVEISSEPPVTPKLRTGKWMDDKCSVCGKGIEDLISSPEWYRNEEPKFCPYCGVKLGGESE